MVLFLRKRRVAVLDALEPKKKGLEIFKTEPEPRVLGGKTEVMKPPSFE